MLDAIGGDVGEVHEGGPVLISRTVVARGVDDTVGRSPCWERGALWCRMVWRGLPRVGGGVRQGKEGRQKDWDSVRSRGWVNMECTAPSVVVAWWQ